MAENNNTQIVIEPAKQVPVAYDVDVVVAGSGIAGTIAAIAAGRYGARTLLVDRFGQLGGNMGPGMFAGGSLHLALINQGDPDDTELVNRMGMGGIPEEFHRRVIFARPNAAQLTSKDRDELERKHYNVNGLRLGSGGGLPGYFVDSQVTAHVALEMLDEVGAETLLSVYASDPIIDGERVCGLFVETISGRLAVRAKIVIDGTGQADVVMRSGAPILQRMAPNMGLWYCLGNVDWPKYEQFQQNHGQTAEDDLAWARQTLQDKASEADAVGSAHHLLPFLRQAWESGEFQYLRRTGTATIRIAISNKGLGMAGGRTGTTGDIDISDAKVYSLMEREHRGQIYRWARFLRKYIPGFENSFLLVMAPFLGARGGRYMNAVRGPSQKDLEAEQHFDDVIYEYNDRRSQKNCDVPYRTLVAQGIDGLMACGRSSMPYGPNFRARYSMLLSGQAAGIAAALCAKEGIEPRNLEVKKLQKILVGLGSPVATQQRLEELGLA